MWVLVLLVLMLYVAGVLAKSFFGDNEHLRSEMMRAHATDIKELFGTVPRSMSTLLGVALHDNANVLQRHIGEINIAAWLFFIIFLVLVSIGM
jgi:hypothetical protein